MADDPDIVVIGAGAAGIGAARRLADAGRAVLILEALPRPGGRAWTRQAAGRALDMGCGWLHSADRNPWVEIATQHGFAIDRRENAWGTQYRDLGFPPEEQAAARAAFARWAERLASDPPASDCAADDLGDDAQWRPYLDALSGYISGDAIDRISAADYAAYDQAATDCNWRLPAGYGTLIAAALPGAVETRLAMPVQAVDLDGAGVAIATASGTVRASAAIVTVSTKVLAGDGIVWPSALDPWRQAAAQLPLGWNEKLFLAIVGDAPFAPESHVLGDPHDGATGTYYIRPLGWPVIECFLGGAGARRAAREGEAAAFARAIDELAGLFGGDVRRCLRPLVASDWETMPSIGGGYSHALPGHAGARARLAAPYDGRLFFAGEATHATDYSTAHGAYLSGVRAAEQYLATI